MQNWWQNAVKTPNQDIQTAAQARQDELTKPQGSLGRLEAIAVQLASLQGQVKPQVNQPHMLIFAADHGIVAQGVSAFPQSVTIAMLANFINGGAAVSALCQAQKIKLSVINCGTATPCEHLPFIQHQPIMPGTNDFSHTAAMSHEQAQLALTLGKTQAESALNAGCDLLLAGEMGIGNTSAASCLSALLLEQDVSRLVGPGTGLHGEGLTQKTQILSACVARAKPLVSTPLQALEQLGGLEIAALAGAYIRAAQLGVPVVIDGFITTAAALLAVKLNPAVRAWMLFAHHSAEPGHGLLLEALKATPLLQLNMRLGEGSGAATAYTLIKNALAVHNNMATFSEAAVENKL